MNATLLATLAVLLCSTFLNGKLCAGLPATNEVARYERYDSEKHWRTVAKSEGDTVLSCLRDIENFKNWGHDRAPNDGTFYHPIPTQLSFRIISASGITNMVHFSSRGELVSYQLKLLDIPELENGLLSELFTKWEAADDTRIRSQPLPCSYTISSADDGGTLSGIAKLFYGDAKQWRHIYEANKTKIKNPDSIQSGIVITIPKPKEPPKKKGAATK